MCFSLFFVVVVVVVFYDTVAADFRWFISQTCLKEASRPTFEQLDSYCRAWQGRSVTHGATELPPYGFSLIILWLCQSNRGGCGCIKKFPKQMNVSQSCA